MAGSADTVSLLATVPFFASLDEKRRKTMASNGKEQSYKQGDKIVGEGATGVGFFLILNGNAEVRKGGKALAKLEKGQFFGEMSLIDGSPRSADVVAASPTTCWVLTSWAFEGLVKSNPEIALVMLKEMVKRLRSAQGTPAS
jgi:CRP/FNR family transcriptional regulator, cyclic AMP receptor protein